MKYNRDIEELKKHATLWWPEDLKSKNPQANILPLLLSTQDDFLRLLSLNKNTPFQIFELIEAAKFQGNIFLKHLVVLSDFGGEPIQRLGRSFKNIFPKDTDENYYFEFLWKNEKFKYEFKSLPLIGLGNKKLGIDGVGLLQKRELDAMLKDMIIILLYASTSNISDRAGLEACEIGSMLGNEIELEKFVKQRYIMVSRIMGGATANNLGQLAQTEIVEHLKSSLGNGYGVTRNGYIKLKGYKKPGGMPFDIVVEKLKKKIGIEVSFQVTTNSTIERKSKDAANNYRLMNKAGHKIAYVIDGVGNFQRSSAISTICNYSDCTVAFTTSEFDILADWIKRELS